MGSIGLPEILLIFLVVLLIFGAKRIPEIARGLGKGIREFKDATNDIKRELTIEDDARRIQQPPHTGVPRGQATPTQEPAPRSTGEEAPRA